MITSLNTSLFAKTALPTCVGFGVRTGRVGSPQAIAMAGGAAIAHAVRTADGNLHALATGCAG
jgi:hypothetical protein